LSAYIKELMLDYGKARRSLIERADIECSLNRLLKTGQINALHIRVLDLFISGYTLTELNNWVRAWFPNRSGVIETVLIQVLSLLEAETGYTDDVFLAYALRLFPRYKKIAKALRNDLFDMGRTFTESE